MNGPEMVAIIVIAVMVASVLKARYRSQRDGDTMDFGSGAARPGGSTASAAENARLRDEIRSLKERIQVLERVVTDNESGARLDREIEKLRDKNNV